MEAQRDSRPLRSVADAEAYVAGVCFKHGPPDRVGVELEWTLHAREDPAQDLDPRHVAAALGPHAPATLSPDSPRLPLTSGSGITVEPGGQVEISTLPARSLPQLIDSVTADVAELDALLSPAGLVRGGTGTDQHRAPRRILDVPRYRAMQALFDRCGPWGATMMCATASMQVCVDAGTEQESTDRWDAIHVAGPAVAALFANSPALAGRSDGWASHRLRATLGTCPPASGPLPSGRDPVTAWVDRVMTAPVVCVRRTDDSCWDPPRPMSFAEWVGGAAGPRPTYDDLDYHLGTIFPPVRPRGYVEIRYVDTQPDDRWHHPLVLLASLLSGPKATQRALEAAEPAAGLWQEAARDGLRHQHLARAAADLVAVAADHLPDDLDDGTAADVLGTLDHRTSTARRQP